ncbi:MAG: GspH/FimT family pseudopilin [Candidatus Sumerlaeota bacterium]|nr:GspH/FimT family pseudopilin [Candidatus Sumerlaeota bacterium]
MRGRVRIATQRGVTFVELVIVVVILSILLVFAVPNMRGIYERNKLVSASRQIISLIRYARAESITGEREIELNFDIEKNKYWLDLKKFSRILGSGDRKAERPELIEQELSLPQFVYFSKVTTEDDEEGRKKASIITFYPDGSATGASIVLVNKTPRKKSPEYLVIEVSHATALPEVYQMSPEELEKMREESATDGENTE